MRPVGYLLNTEGGLAGEPGLFYNYILAGNGLFLEAENPLLRARVHLAEARVRGLRPLEPCLELRHGRVPGHLLTLAVNTMLTSPDREMYAAITWEADRYRILVPGQERDRGHVTYEPTAGTLVGIHSHGHMGAFFSSTDDQDEQGLLAAVVLGHLETLLPQARARLCVYGYFAPVRLAEVFTETPALEEEWNTDW